MIKSPLTNSVVEANSSNYSSGRSGYSVCKITPHHMAGILTGEQCARLFQSYGRQASANYCIGYDGDIVLSVGEENRAWTSSNKANDCQAITIEVSNDSIGGDWHISDKSWDSLVNLCVDICKRYNFRLNYTWDKYGSLTRHNMFTSTTCPRTLSTR
jgi:N-acetyl-anhydromuramyl-L-alanine amidase AmpD